MEPKMFWWNSFDDTSGYYWNSMIPWDTLGWLKWLECNWQLFSDFLPELTCCHAPIIDNQRYLIAITLPRIQTTTARSTLRSSACGLAGGMPGMGWLRKINLPWTQRIDWDWLRLHRLHRLMLLEVFYFLENSAWWRRRRFPCDHWTCCFPEPAGPA